MTGSLAPSRVSLQRTGRLATPQAKAVVPEGCRFINQRWAKARQFDPVTPRDVAMIGPSTAPDRLVAPQQLQDLGQQARPLIDEALYEAGAVLLQGLPLVTPEACEAFICGLSYQQQEYQPSVGPPRRKIGSLDAATNIPGDYLVDLHNESIANPLYPAKIFLMCLNPACKGGENLIASGEAITAGISHNIMQRFADKGGIKYTRIFRSQESVTSTNPLISYEATWQERASTKDKSVAAALFESLGCTVQWTGCKEDTLEAWNIKPAVVPNPATGEPLWLNVAHIHPFLHCSYGDGEPIEDEVLEAIDEARMAVTKSCNLGPGEMLMLDNTRYLHGRMPYEGNERKMITILTSD
eukprot:GHRR01002296.1.p1 GENE.GHRR01002296.1~~GHRR01002296.1.p1  ORF type:complete len:354 (+),score=75.06 GHRR01002296.1:452-1513(+)